MDEVTTLEKSGWQLVPRKIIGGLFAMLLIAKASVDLKGALKWQFALTIISMTMLGAMAIWTHYLLERGPKLKKAYPSTSSGQASDEYHPDIPDESQT